MNAMAPPRPSQLQECRVRLASGPAASGVARDHVRAALRSWGVRVDQDAAILLTSELVTNAIRHADGRAITLVIACSLGRFRVEVHDMSPSMPVVMDAKADAEAGRGLMLVATLADEWGVCLTPPGKSVHFTLALQTELADGGRGS